MPYILRFILPVIILASALGSYYVGSVLHKEIFTVQEQRHDQLRKECFEGIQTIASKIQSVYKIAASLEEIAQIKTADMLEKKLTDVMNNNKLLTSCSIAFAPYIYNKDTELFSRRVVRTAEGLLTYAIETKEDYSTTEWFRRAQRSILAWGDPFFDDVSKQMVIRYSYPFFIIDPVSTYQVFAGVTNITISIVDLTNLVMSMSLEKDTYCILVEKNGLVLSVSSDDTVYQEKTLTTLAREQGKKDFIHLENQIKQHDEGEMTMVDEAQSKLSKIIFKKIPETSWVLILMHLENTEFISSHAIFRYLMLLLLMVMTFIASVLSIIFFLIFDNIRAAWLTSSCAALLMATAIAEVWTLDILSNIPWFEYGNVVDTQLALERFFFLQKKSNPQIYKKEPHFIPTGIFITSLDVGHDASVTVGGQVWQKYDRIKYPNDEPGVVFFNATDQLIEKIYSTEKNSIETIGWRFRATIPAHFNYLKYPFDEQKIILSLGHKDYLMNTILIPDFSSFKSTDTTKAEIDPSAQGNQWVIEEAYPFYELTDFSTNFGIQGYAHQKGFPHLSFAISVWRQFVYPLTASALPVTIILFVVFSIVLFTGLTIYRTTLATEVIKLTSSIFFGAAVAHQTFQRSLQSPVITYFEYFYFLIYAIILLTAINGMLYAYNRGGVFINFKNNLLPRLFYWPVTLFLSLLLTLIFFY